MAKTIGVILTEGISAGLVVNHKLEGVLRRFRESEDDIDALVELHMDALVQAICEQVVLAANGAKDIAAVGLAVPGLVKNGVVEEAPNLPQLKGARLQERLAVKLRNNDIGTAVTIVNAADGRAAGRGRARGKLGCV